MVKLTNKQIQCIGIALNTSNCQSEASDHKDRLSKEYGLPCLDPLQDSLDPFIQIIEKKFETLMSYSDKAYILGFK